MSKACLLSPPSSAPPLLSLSSSSAAAATNSDRHFRSISIPNFIKNNTRLSSHSPCSASATTEKKTEGKEAMAAAAAQEQIPEMKLLFVEMGVGYDQHGQDITVAAMRACKDAISSNSIPAFRTGSIPGVNYQNMKLKIQLGVPRSTQQFLDIERVKSVFPYGQIVGFEVMDGGMICSSGVCLEAMGDKNDDCYIVNAAVHCMSHLQALFRYQDYFIWQDQVVVDEKLPKLLELWCLYSSEVNLLKPRRIDGDIN